MIDLVIFDWKRTLYDPDSKVLIDGARKLLNFLKSKNLLIILIGKGGEDMNDEVKRLSVEDYFKEIVFAQGEKDPNIFAKYISKDEPKDTVLVGDRVRSELEIGNKLGAMTLWVKQGKFASEEPENKEQVPDYTVPNLSECQQLLKKILV